MGIAPSSVALIGESRDASIRSAQSSETLVISGRTYGPGFWKNVAAGTPRGRRISKPCKIEVTPRRSPGRCKSCPLARPPKSPLYLILDTKTSRPSEARNKRSSTAACTSVTKSLHTHFYRAAGGATIESRSALPRFILAKRGAGANKCCDPGGLKSFFDGIDPARSFCPDKANV
jgi:hypothetical protein